MEDMAAAYYHHHPASSSHYPSSYYHPPPPHLAPPPPPAPLPPPSHQPPPFSHLAPPPYSHHQNPPLYSASYSLDPPQDELRTLFIAGLPDDVKEREIYNLFREFPGYQSCQLRGSGQSTRAYAFAVFIDQHSAVTAMHALNGMVFDLEKESTLYINLAKCNSRGKRSRADDGASYSSDKKIRETVPYSRDILDTGVGSNIYMPGLGNSAYSMNGYPSTQSHTSFDYGTMKDTDPNKYVPQNTTPCPTLFVANLGPTCSEQELTEVFARCPGFLKLKMQNKHGVPVAFVDFQDVSASTGAINHLQGTLLHSSVEGMRLEFAKSRMGLRRREKKT